ncbi:SDR family oxidoreductase [Domibacillus sp. PGB-M46]|uniref:SDR family oxidoreductase n=1 Tax=Domibacillus sp. PGB-M46 TaxID=2910255 RepID=UPI001F57C907|nr:SDR family oxidoreductase [Domibacillus sp. PGB-M46]MCI2255104.1 SDR family oxidoreductase [Domibacillus sp. PGB-M46]
MHVLVIGAAGTTGRLVVQSLAENIQHHVKAMVRKTDQMADMEQLGARPVLADLEQDFSYAMNDVNAVIFAAGSGSATGPDKTTAIDRDGAIKAIDLAVSHGIERFVMLSSMGADRPDTGPEALQHYLRAKHEADAHLMMSGLTYTIVRPGALSNEAASGKIEAAPQVANRTKSIARADVAEVLVQSLLAPQTEGRIFEIVEGTVPIAEALKAL